MTRRALAAIALFSIAALPSLAQEIGDYGVGHPQWHHWYETGENGGPLMRPTQPDVKCCGADCRPTKAMFKNGSWFAWIDHGWEPVPNDRIKFNLTAPNSGAHICASQRTEHARPVIFCFVPPEAGS